MTDWNNGIEAGRAIIRGDLPSGCKLRDDGALIVPHLNGGVRLRGHSTICAQFDEIVTTEGEVLKSRMGDAR